MSVEMVLALLFAIPLGIGLALYIVASLLERSNNFGDSRAGLADFSDQGHFQGRKSWNNINPDSTPLPPTSNPIILAHREEIAAKKQSEQALQSSESHEARHRRRWE
ncbi:MAG: hypothetical protein KBT07_01725 [Clostridiales bacterium]|nr:hypothetical protein [Candidatus Scatonaster coprocaballi]